MSKKTVLIAMSGGVDSSVSAALLKKQGYEVKGIGLKLIPEKLKEMCYVADNCCGKRGFKDAKKIAGKIGIPFFVIDVSQEFKDTVIDYFTDSYLNGLTPNPCIICNKKIKFDILLEHANSLDINYISTGHYVKNKKNNNHFELFKAEDDNKDQSYFLYNLDQKHLKKSLFPMGKFKKTETKKIARKYNLPVGNREESQDICFIQKGNYDKFVEEFTEKEIPPGPIKNSQGKQIGTHKGFIRYTIGQRRGLGISHSHPLYVSDIIPEKNTIIASPREEVSQKKLKVNNLSWINEPPSKDVFNASVKIRLNHNSAKATIKHKKNKATLEFKEAQWAITPGQATVFYKGDKVLGGGVISS